MAVNLDGVTDATHVTPTPTLPESEVLQERALNAVNDLQVFYQQAKQCNLSLDKVKKAYVIKCNEFLVKELKIFKDDSVAKNLNDTDLRFISHKVISNNAHVGVTFDNIERIQQYKSEDKAQINKIACIAIVVLTLWYIFRGVGPAAVVALIAIRNILKKQGPIRQAEEPFMASFQQWALNVQNVDREVTQADVEKDYNGLTLLHNALKS